MTSGEIPSEYYVSDDEENSNSSGDEGTIENGKEAEKISCDEGSIENDKKANQEEDSSESSGFESDDDDELSTSSDESMIMPYTIDDIQLPPHPKRIKWSDEAFSSSTGDGTGGGDDKGTDALSLLVSTRLIPGGRLGRHFWTLDDVPEGSSFRFSNVSNKDRRRMRKERMHSVAQERKEEKKKKKEKADSASEAAPQCQGGGVSSDISPETTKITPDDCVSDHEDLDDIIGDTGDYGNGDDDAESATSEGSGWGASRRLSDIGGDLDDEDDDDEKETDDNLAAGQRIEHSIQNMDTVQREKLVEAMMNDILKSMRAIEKRKREESEEQPEKNNEEGPTTPMSIDTEKPVDEVDAPINERKFDIEPIDEDNNKSNPGDEVKAETEEEYCGSDEDESDFFVDLLTDENVDDFVQAQAVEWMDDAQKDDDDDEDEEDEFNKFLEDYSSSRLSDGEEDVGVNATGSLSPGRTNEDDELVFNHRFMDGGDDVDIDEDTADLKNPAVEQRRKGSAPAASRVSSRSQRPARPTLPPRQISSKRNLSDSSKSTSKKKKKKKTFAKRMFKISLQGEIDETKRKMEMRRHGSHTSGLSDHDSISTDLNGSYGSFRSNTTGRDSMGRLGSGSGSGREQSMMHDRRPVSSGRHVQMRRSTGIGSTVSSGGSGGSVDASRRQHRHIPGGGSSVARGQGPRPPGSSRGSTSCVRGRGPISRPPGGAAPREVRSSVRGTGRGSGVRGTVMRAPGRGARRAPPQRSNIRSSGVNSTSGHSKNIRPPTEGQCGHNLRTSLSSSGTGGKSTRSTAAPKGGRSNHQQQHATAEGGKKKKKKLFKLNLKSELVD